MIRYTRILFKLRIARNFSNVDTFENSNELKRSCLSANIGDGLSETDINSSDLVIPNTNCSKIIRVAIVGAPNAGKSTLVNQLVGQKVCSVSKKVHTTRCKTKAALVRGDTQILFVDTPGLVSEKEAKRHRLDRNFVEDGITAASDVNFLGVIHDASNRWTRDRFDSKIISLLEKTSFRKSFLILNKVDAVKNKKKLLDIVRLLTEGKKEDDQKHPSHWPHFSQVFMVSAITGDGVDSLIDFFLEEAKPGRWMFPSGKISDRPKHILIEDFVKARLLEHLPQEIPYVIDVKMEYFSENDLGEIVSVVLVKCPALRYEKMLLSRGGSTIKKVALAAEEDARDAFLTGVRLRLVVKTEKKT